MIDGTTPMPTMPAPLARRAERWFARPAVVTASRVLSPGLRRVTIVVPGLVGRAGTAGQEVEFLVSERDFRHYTAACFNPADGSFDIVFALHGAGPGSAWAAGLQPGDPVPVMGPGGGVRWQRPARPVLLGDATAIGLFMALAADLPPGGDLAGAVEVPAADVVATRELLPRLRVLAAEAAPGAALRDWLAAARPLLAEDRYYLVGHAQTINTLRALLRDRGATRSNVITKAYWATGRRGL